MKRWMLVAVFAAVAIVVVTFSLTVWPTPYRYYKTQSGQPVKENRFTGQAYKFNTMYGWESMP